MHARVTLLLAVLAAPVAAAPSAPLFAPKAPAAPRAASAPPLRLATSAAPLARLAPAATAATASLESIAAWNRGNGKPWRNGFVRPLSGDRRVVLGAASGPVGGLVAKSADGSLVWGGEVVVEGAWRLRLHLTDLDLPDGTRIWAYDALGRSRDAIIVGPSTGADLWTPSVAGPAVRLEIALPADAGEAAFTLGEAMEIVRLEGDGTPAPAFSLTPRVGECLVDAGCIGSDVFPVIDLARRAIAQLYFVEGSLGYVCTGGLLNDNLDSGDPLLLTANHCIDTEAEADSLEATWDFYTGSCDGTPPDFDQLPRTFGADLLATRASSDFTLLRLDSLPANRVFLGWSAEPGDFNNGETYHRLSYPVPDNTVFALVYSQHEREPDFNLCEDVFNDTTSFHHTNDTLSGTFGGSSGSPLMNDVGQVLGQLTGACPNNASDPFDGCDRGNDTVDGAFSRTFATIEPFLLKDDGPECPAGFFEDPEYPDFCFDVTIVTPAAEVIDGTPEADCQPDTVCVSGALAGRSEVFLRILGPRPNGFLWPTIVRFTPSEVTVVMYQRSTGLEQTYVLDAVPPGSDELSGLQDREGFLP